MNLKVVTLPNNGFATTQSSRFIIRENKKKKPKPLLSQRFFYKRTSTLIRVKEQSSLGFVRGFFVFPSNQPRKSTLNHEQTTNKCKRKLNSDSNLIRENLINI